MNQFARTKDFEKVGAQEDLLAEVNRLLAPAENAAFAEPRLTPSKPIVFIVGAPRSGTTLMLQWLANSREFAYPSNLLSRFYGAPFIGARIQQLLTNPELDFRGELLDLHDQRPSWKSEIGKTSGVLEPHEFSYFWRRFFPIDQAQKLTPQALEESDPEGFVDGWARLERAYGKPVAAKGILLQYDIDRLAEWLPKAIFIHTSRDPFFNAQSLLRARKRVFGTTEAWFSVRPPEFEWLQRESVSKQVVGQILFTNRAIERQLAELPEERAIRVEYEAFCSRPADVWARLRQSMEAMGSPICEYSGPGSFESTNEVRLESDEAERLRDALAAFRGAVTSATGADVD